MQVGYKTSPHYYINLLTPSALFGYIHISTLFYKSTPLLLHKFIKDLFITLLCKFYKY